MRAAPLALASLALTIVACGPGCALLEPQPPLALSVYPGAPPPGRIFAGAAKVALTPLGRPVPLAGFGPHPAFATDVNVLPSGEREELYARALSLRGERAIDRGIDRVVLVSIDMLIVTESFRQEVLDQLRALMPPSPEETNVPTDVILCATHTHFGIGGFWKGALPEALSIGPYDAELTRAIALKVARAIEGAVSAERPARFSCSAPFFKDLPELVVNRAVGKDVIDSEFLMLFFDGEDGKHIAIVSVFASHPTELYGEEKLSPAWPGSCARELERVAEGATALVLQGGVGDQKPTFPQRVQRIIQEDRIRDATAAATTSTPTSGRLAKSRAYGKAVATALRSSDPSTPAPKIVLRLARAPFSLPLPTLGACPIPILDRILAVPVVLPYWKDETVLRVLRMGDVALAFVPFELCAETTLRVKARLRKAGYADAAVISLANDWLGYAPDGVPWPWHTSGLTSFGGTGMGYALGERLSEQAERIGPSPR